MKLTHKGKQHKNKQKGIALLEMIIAIGIIGIITAAVVALSSSAFAEQKMKDTISNISQLTTTIQRAYSNANSYNGLAASDFSDDLKKNPYGGSFNISKSAIGSNADAGFTIGIGGLDVDTCVDLLQSIGKNYYFAKVAAAAPSDIGTGGISDFSPSNLKTVECKDAAVNPLWLGDR
ncbi:Toxin coregulated pilin precursor [Vibrio mediterranei]|uniref:Uncharacterized protein n=1 Tax=Vibrio mediterranei TaxID=689 RepID=A0ABX5DDH4_9VIBR|nr:MULTISPECIES: prepilin-type N-terminal cleavage/methylation domain-containing protein [Vibrio]KFA99300.1 hypothetical protein HW45_04570 [Vibrio sp. ER1A]PCD87838.1 hypothetical protein COR52_13855 [Vibrio mediterranei]PRQ67103.1 hypothetical protein COR51_13310 [Vibrio mediterranei]SBO12064.1 Toxin coregulated pilin precursor [Vibrio mediterranei]